MRAFLCPGETMAKTSETPVAGAGSGSTFRDKLYTSRTLILPSGAAVPVAKGRACAVDDDQFQYLNTHPDFERLTE